MEDRITEQLEKIKTGNPAILLTDSCRIGQGIEAIDEGAFYKAISSFEDKKEELSITFFIPASGSGSRMFSKLYQAIQTGESNEFLDNFILNIHNFAFYAAITDEWKAKIQSGTVNKVEFARYLLTDEGLGLGQLPKGLVPFHIIKDEILTPFQAHLKMGKEMVGFSASFHFTVNPHYMDEITENVEELEIADELTYTFTVQDPSTDSVAFDAKLKPAIDNRGKVIERPAGHGALIKNLDQIDADLVFIRNIDNVQHEDKAEKSIATRKALAGLLLQFQEAVFNVLSKIERGHAFESTLKTLNDKFDLRLTEKQLTQSHHAFEALNRPIRVCGMVKNEGAPGGGPFWVRSVAGQESRQIVEKSQISADPQQLALMEKATHFNPVELVCGVRNYEGKKFSLVEFVDHNQYFIVEKTQEGKKIKYIEQPGLWNGGMAEWLTLFYEIDADCFSPVKTVLDLLKDAHQGI